MTLSSLSMKQLTEVLKTLKHGSIGFDVFRNSETNTKDKLIAYIALHHADAAIIAAVQAVSSNLAFEMISEEIPPPNYTPIPVPAEKPAPQQIASIDPSALGQQLAAIIAASMPQAPSLDESRVKTLIGAALFEYESVLRDLTEKQFAKKLAELDRPTRIEILNPVTQETKDMGLQHMRFEALLKMVQARQHDGNRLNIWLKGPAGSGKTTAAKKVAEALNMPFQFNGAISTEYDLMGFKDASGAYHRTAFREIFENGGVYLFDEVDSSLPKAVLAFNAALANGECRFPDGMIKRHPDCVVLAGANTAGNGATSDYVGRMKQDLAFLNRFVMLDWPLDEKLEMALATNKAWAKKVQKFRKNAEKRSIKGHIISPRATFYGEALLATGLDEETVEQACLRGALSADQWETLCQ